MHTAHTYYIYIYSLYVNILYRQVCMLIIYIYMHMHIHNIHNYIHTYIHTYVRIGRPTGRQTDRQTHIFTYIRIYIQRTFRHQLLLTITIDGMGLASRLLSLHIGWKCIFWSSSSTNAHRCIDRPMMTRCQLEDGP